jgi:hypothetical protein
LTDAITGFRDAIDQAWHGPLAFRLILQPAVAAVLGIRAGLQDARAGRTPAIRRAVYGGAVARRQLLREGWADVGRLFLIAVVADLIYQAIALHQVHLIHAVLFALLLALPTYLATRGLTNRIARQG